MLTALAERTTADIGVWGYPSSGASVLDNAEPGATWVAVRAAPRVGRRAGGTEDMDPINDVPAPASPMGEALKRSAVGGSLVAAATALGVWQTQRGDAYQGEDTLLAFAITLIGYLIARGAAEGWIDSARRQAGTVQPSDVGYVAAVRGGAKVE